jgi:quercetin dioxygenase-like cupin family protein
MKLTKLAVGITVVFGAGVFVGGARTQTMSLEGRLFKSPTSGTTIRMLLDESNLGGAEIEIGEITFAPGSSSGDHPHGSTEVFYVLSGELEHIVNGESHVLKPGMLGFVRPPDQVNHVVGNETTKALVIWAPGGEAGRVLGSWTQLSGR